MPDGSDTPRSETGKSKPANTRTLPPVETRWAKGVSGNPRGRPKKDFDLAERAQKETERAVKTLVAVMDNPKASANARVAAAAEILDRAYGTAPQSINMHVQHSLAEEFEALLAEIHENRQKARLDVIQGRALQVVDSDD